MWYQPHFVMYSLATKFEVFCYVKSTFRERSTCVWAGLYDSSSSFLPEVPASANVLFTQKQPLYVKMLFLIAITK